jgi:hypothetical protein
METCTCHTDGCENNGIPIEMLLTYEDDAGNTLRVDSVVCGACGQTITDIVESEPAK